MLIYLSLLVSIVGLIIMFASEKPKIQEIGKIMFWTGLLAFLLTDTQLLGTTGAGGLGIRH